MGGGRPFTAALIALLGYGLTRWLLEPFHAQSATLPGGLLTAQVAGLALALLALWLLRPRAAAPPSG
jgi:prolipoprotein diacylglyceryltransferase